MVLTSETRSDEVVRHLGEFIAAKQRLEALFVEQRERGEVLSAAEAGTGAAALASLEQQASAMQKKYFLGEVSIEEVSAVQRRFEDAKTVASRQDERLSTLRASLRETEKALQETHSQIESLQLALKTSLREAFNVRFDRQRLWKLQREGELQWRKLIFACLYEKIYLNRAGVEDCMFFSALQAFFTDAPFRIRVIKGFRYPDPQENGPPRTLIFNKSDELVSVPEALGFEAAFTEIVNGRAIFVPKD